MTGCHERLALVEAFVSEPELEATKQSPFQQRLLRYARNGGST